MKLFGLLRKPDWEHKDAAVRLRAVLNSHEPALLARLDQLAQSDPDAQVRAAALRRCDDPALLERRLRGDSDAAVVAVARERLIDVLCRASVAIDSRVAALLHVHDGEVLQRVAERAPESQLRRTALERIDRPGILFERCLRDADGELRLWLLARIDGAEALQRLIDGARNKDKRLTRAAREKLAALQLASGDGEALQRRVLALCEQISRLGRELPDDRDSRLLGHRAEWNSLREHASADLQRRVEGCLAMAQSALDGAAGRLPPRPASADDVPADATDEAAVAETAVEAAQPLPSPELDDLLAALPGSAEEDLLAQLQRIDEQAAGIAAAQADNPRVAAQLAELQAQLQRRRAQHARERSAEAEQHAAARKHEWLAQLEQLDIALAEGSLATARPLHHALHAADLPADLRRRLGRSEAAIAKLERWQHWSSNKVRQRLCDDVAALLGSGLHPDAVAHRIKELQAEWARLDALAGESAASAEHGLGKRFRALCHQALAPTRAYFEKRRELRDERALQTAALLANVDERLAEGSSDLPGLRKLVVDALRELDGLPPQARGEHGRALRQRLGSIDAAQAQLREQAALGKRRLIARLRRELTGADPAAAMSLAKTAQAEWKTLARADREQEDALWAELRELIDPLFAASKQRESLQREQEQQADAAARELLEELQALAAAGDDKLQHAQTHIDTLSARWRSLTTPAEAPLREQRGSRDGRDGRDDKRNRARPPRPPAHPLDAQFNSALARVQAAQAQAQQRRERQIVAAINEAAELLDRLQASSDDSERSQLQAQFSALALPADARAALQARLLQTAGAGDAAEQAELLAVRAELAAGLESPASALELRRVEQRQRLAIRLGGAALPPAGEEIRTLLIALAALSGLTGAQRQSLQQRVLQAWQQTLD